MVILGISILLNLAGAFLCSLSEAALLACNEARILARREGGDRHMSALLGLKRDIQGTLAAIVFMNNVFAVGGTAAITAAATQVLSGALDGTGISVATGVGILIVLQTLLIIAFAEVVPKVLAEAHPEAIAGRLTPAIVWTRRILAPVLWLLGRVLTWTRPPERVPAGEETEIRQLTRLGEAGGHIHPDEAELIRRVFRLDDIVAEDVMTPRPLIQAFAAGARIGEIRDELLAAHHRRFPVYEKDLDAVSGILWLRDALAALMRGEYERTVGELQHRALFLPTSRAVDDVLRDMQVDRAGMAVVLDEYGVTEGVITLDDLIEELVGEAIDASDLRAGLVKRLSRDTALVHGLTRVRDVARFLGCPVVYEDVLEETTTVTGLLHARLQRIPEVGDCVQLDGALSLTVQEADDRAALRVLARHHRTRRDRAPRSTAEDMESGPPAAG